MKRSTFLAAALAAALLPLAASAQTDWPTKPVNMVVPYPPGGLNDAVARVYADKLTAILGKTVLVDNRAGAATTVASNSVAKAAPDGYTIYAGGTSLIVNPTLTGNVQYDPHKSFDLVSLMSFTPFILQVNADFPPKNMAGADRLPEGQSRQVQHGELRRRRDQPHGGRAVQGAHRAQVHASCPIAAARRAARTWRRATRR